MEARIYQPAKNVMQSGQGNTKKWVLEFEPTTAPKAEGLMGWTGGGSTMDQIRMKFSTKEEAISFAERKGIAYQVIEPQKRKIKIRNYADNFAYSAVAGLSE
jgi:hypothetical protein